MKTSQPTPMQHTPLQSPQVITLGLYCFLWSCNGSERASNETKGILSINSMGSGSGPTSVWPSLYTVQPIYSLSVPGPLSPIASIFSYLWLSLATLSTTPSKRPSFLSLAASPLPRHSHECCPNPISFQPGNSLSFLLVQVSRLSPFKLPSSSYSSYQE